MSSYSRDEDELAEIRFHWGSAYNVLQLGPDAFIAQRRDHSRAVVKAETPAGLLELIRADYQARPVPRKDSGPWLP